jgi:hypothetical protein
MLHGQSLSLTSIPSLIDRMTIGLLKIVPYMNSTMSMHFSDISFIE